MLIRVEETSPSIGIRGLPPPAGQPWTDADLLTQACNECQAHGQAMSSIVYRYEECGWKSPCSLISSINDAAGIDCLVCFFGVGAAGPASPNPCDVATVPCSP